MDIEQLREYCLSKPGTEETLPFGPDTLVFKVRGKIYLLAGLNNHPLQFNAKCNPDKAIELREAYPEHILPGYHMNKKHWNTVIVDGTVSSSLIRELVDHSYALVAGRESSMVNGQW